MDFPLLDRALWLAGFVCHVTLLLVLIAKSRWRSFPVFTVLIGFSTLRTILLYWIYRYGSEHTYDIAFWIAAVIDVVLQLGLVFEMARVVLRPTGIWVREARNVLLFLGGSGGVIAAALTSAIHTRGAADWSDWIDKGHFFATLLFCELFASMMVASSRLGLVWRNHVMGLGRGLTAWAIVSLVIEAFHSYFGEDWHANLLDHIQMIVYLSATIYWIFTFWSSEPNRRTLSPEMQQYLSNLEKQIQGDSRSEK